MNKRNSYTLIELLLVICITLVIFGATIPAFHKISMAQAVPNATRALAGKMYLLRNCAVEQRKTVAMAFYRGSGTHWYRPAIIAKDAAGHYDFKSWIEEASNLPITVKFSMQTRRWVENPITHLSELKVVDSFSGQWKNSVQTTEFVSSPGNTYEWFIYKPTGQAVAPCSTSYLAIRPISRPDIDGWPTTSTSHTDPPDPLFHDGEVSINQFTGRLSFNEE